MQEPMELDTHHMQTDAEHPPFLDKKKSHSFLDRSKLGFKPESCSPRAGSSARDKILNQRRFGSQKTESSPTAHLHEGLTSLKLCSPRSPDSNRSFGFNDYRTPVRSHSSPATHEGSPMEVDSCSPELTETRDSLFTTAALWSTGTRFDLSPKKSDVVPNPYAVQQVTQRQQGTCLVPDVVDLCQDEDENVPEEEEMLNTMETEKEKYRSQSIRRPIMPGLRGTVRQKTPPPPSPRRAKCWYVKFICYLQLFLLFFVLVALGILHVAETYKARTCVTNQRLNTTGIQRSLQGQVYGQHIAFDMVSKALDELMEVQRTVVLSFHGWTGIGKTFVSSIITNHITTPSVHRIIIPLHFPHLDEDEIYQDRIYEWIISNITSCAVNVFVIDEMDKATEGIVLGLAAVLKDIRDLDLNNSRVLVVLISNTGGAAINRFAFRHLESGYHREQLVGSGLVAGILSDDDTEWLQVLHNEGVIDHVVPFLPLERQHVKLCVEAYLKTFKNYNLDHVDIGKILDDFVYLPKDFPIFSKSGCRQVNSKVDLAVDIEHQEYRDEL